MGNQSNLTNLSNGAKWVSITPADVQGSAPSLPGVSDLPFDGFQFLRHAANVRVTGGGVIAGDKVTRYSFTMDLSAALKSKGIDPQVKRTLESASALTNLSAEPGTAAIDNQGYVRQLGMTVPLSDGNATVDIASDTTYSDFGQPVNLIAPPPNEVAPFSQVGGDFGLGSA